MKMVIMIISSLFICSLSFSDWINITAGVPLKITDIDKGDVYDFTLKSSEYSKLSFSFIMSNIYKNLLILNYKKLKQCLLLSMI